MMPCSPEPCVPGAVGSCLVPTAVSQDQAADGICSCRRSSSSPQPGEGRDVHFITRWQVFKNKSAEQQPALAADQSFDIAKDKSRFGKVLFSLCSPCHATIPGSGTGGFVGLLCFALAGAHRALRPGSPPSLRVIKLC